MYCWSYNMVCITKQGNFFYAKEEDGAGYYGEVIIHNGDEFLNFTFRYSIKQLINITE